MSFRDTIARLAPFNVIVFVIKRYYISGKTAREKCKKTGIVNKFGIVAQKTGKEICASWTGNTVNIENLFQSRNKAKKFSGKSEKTAVFTLRNRLRQIDERFVICYNI
jgi:hypothetical protein